MLPADWPERARVADPESGELRVEPPLESVWRSGEELDPPAGIRLASTSPELSPETYVVEYAPAARRLPAWTVRDPIGDEDIDAMALRRLERGRNAYRVVALDPDDAHSAQRVLGAVLDEDGDLLWVELVVLRFEDGRSLAGRVVHAGALASATAVNAAGLVVVVGGGIWLTVVVFDALIDSYDGL